MTAIRLRARIATLLHAGSTTPLHRIGAFTLRPAQREAHDRILRALADLGGAVLLDPPGSGKTVVALAVAGTLHASASPPTDEAAEVARTLVIGPAVVRAQWLATALRAEVPIRFLSLEALSRGTSVATAAAPDLIILDEAHHLRTPSTRRFAAAARLCARARVLALTATPVVNRRADLVALLRLFLGARAERMDGAALARCLIRRTEPVAARPMVRHLAPLRIAPPPAWLAPALQTLPDPWPMPGTHAPIALISMGLAMAWQSSLAALEATLRRREQRGGALLDLLAAGVMPSEMAVRAWTLDETATQLAWPLLVDPPREGMDSGLRTGIRMAAIPTRTSVDLVRATAQVQRHLAAVREIRLRLAPSIAVDTAARIDALRRLLRRFPASRIAVLSQRTETIRALYHGLRGTPGVVAIAGPRVLAAAGRWSRDAVLRALGPAAPPLRPDDPTMIRLLLATDVLAEGIELQGVQLLVHADLPWTPARLEQRLGRLTRIGSSTTEVRVTRFRAPAEMRPLLRLAERLRAKEVSRTAAVRAGVVEDAIARRLARWADEEADATHLAVAGSTEGAPDHIGAVRASREGFLAVVTIEGERRLVGGLRRRTRGTRWRVTEYPSDLLTLCRLADGPSRRVGAGEAASAARRIQRWDVVRRVGALSDPVATMGPLPGRLQRRLERILACAPAIQRAELARRTQPLLDRVRFHLPEGQERALTEALTLDDARCLAAVETLLATTASAPRPAHRPAARIEALLLIGPDETPEGASTYAQVSTRHPLGPDPCAPVSPSRSSPSPR